MAGKSEITGIGGIIPTADREIEGDGPSPGAATAQRNQRIRRAREAAAALIEELTAGQALSFEVNEFLHTTWSSVLFRVHLATGPESNHWKHLARISATLVWTMKPKHSEAERNKILKMIPSMLRALSRGMALVRIGAEVQDEIFQMLAQQHALVIKLTARNIAAGEAAGATPPTARVATAKAAAEIAAEIKSAEATVAAAEAAAAVAEPLAEVERTAADRVIDDLEQFTLGVNAGDIRVDEASLAVDESAPEPAGADDWVNQAAGLELGSWIEFSEPPSRVLLARLSWKSKVSGNLVFVNRKGRRVRSMSIAELADELGAGRATRVEASSVFDIAVYAIMNRLAG